MTRTLRLRLCCERPETWRDRVQAALLAADIATVDAEGDAAEAPRHPATLVLFDAPTAEVLDAVDRASRGGRERTFAVATHPRALEGTAAWQLLSRGASDAFPWGPSGDSVAHIAARLERWARIDGLLETPAVRRELIGSSPRWLACLRQVVEMSVFSNGPVLLLGESGTGKELLARLVHTLDQRPDRGELVILDCTTVVPELSGSEFFGHERGAFTGAACARDGAFALANGGTLFLDEVGELPLSLQAQLLRAVQERTYKRVGSNTWQRTNFRLICATHRDLAENVAAGRFRADFYHRIASRICHLPPLRARREDVLPLARHFLHGLCPESQAVELDRSVERFLVDRDYPGNVRELKQLVGRIGDRHVGPGPITAGDIPEDERPVVDTPAVAAPAARVPSFDEAVAEALRRGIGLREIARVATGTAIKQALACEDGNLQRAARRLGVTDRALQLRRAHRPGAD
jgi:transcriptional regulator with GAF, ATPase, and Fis domain